MRVTTCRGQKCALTRLNFQKGWCGSCFVLRTTGFEVRETWIQILSPATGPCMTLVSELASEPGSSSANPANCGCLLGRRRAVNEMQHVKALCTGLTSPPSPFCYKYRSPGNMHNILSLTFVLYFTFESNLAAVSPWWPAASLPIPAARWAASSAAQSLLLTCPPAPSSQTTLSL